MEKFNFEQTFQEDHRKVEIDFQGVAAVVTAIGMASTGVAQAIILVRQSAAKTAAEEAREEATKAKEEAATANVVAAETHSLVKGIADASTLGLSAE